MSPYLVVIGVGIDRAQVLATLEGMCVDAATPGGTLRVPCG